MVAGTRVLCAVTATEGEKGLNDINWVGEIREEEICDVGTEPSTKRTALVNKVLRIRKQEQGNMFA